MGQVQPFQHQSHYHHHDHLGQHPRCPALLWAQNHWGCHPGPLQHPHPLHHPHPLPHHHSKHLQEHRVVLPDHQAPGGHAAMAGGLHEDLQGCCGWVSKTWKTIIGLIKQVGAQQKTMKTCLLISFDLNNFACINHYKSTKPLLPLRCQHFAPWVRRLLPARAVDDVEETWINTFFAACLSHRWLELRNQLSWQINCQLTCRSGKYVKRSLWNCLSSVHSCESHQSYAWL